MAFIEILCGREERYFPTKNALKSSRNVVKKIILEIQMRSMIWIFFSLTKILGSISNLNIQQH
jgi:hypothetical protein